MSMLPSIASEASVLFNSGFMWNIELTRGDRLGEEAVLALRDAFLAVRTTLPILDLEFATLAETVMRIKPELIRANGCTLPLSPLGISSGAMAHLQVATWPQLQAELERRGVVAEGPAQTAAPAREVHHLSRKERTPLLRCRLFFDPALVGPADAFAWVKKPAQSAVELGVASADGVSMAGIDYLNSDGQTIHAWTATLQRPEDARDVGGLPPIWIAHRTGDLLPASVRRTLRQAAGEAIRETAVHVSDAVSSDVNITVCARAVVVRMGARVGDAVRATGYERLVQNLADALRRVGVQAEAVFEAGCGLPMLDEFVPVDAAFIVCPDVDLSVTRLIEVDRALAREGDSESLQEEFRRLSGVPWGRLSLLSVCWLPEPGSPLFGRTPKPMEEAQLTVYATAKAPLPLSAVHRAREWVDLVLNGGRQGFPRAMQEVDQSDRISAIAIARAHAARYLKRPLPVRRRADLDTFRLHCGQRLAEFGRTANTGQLARVIAEILVASAREPSVADDLVRAVSSLLMNAGKQPPLVLVLGEKRTWLLRAPDRRRIWADLARSLMDEGHEEDLATIWSDHPMGIIPSDIVDEAMAQVWQTGGLATDETALAAFAGWALRDARERRMHGVRGAEAYVSVAEPRLRQTGLERAYFLRETETHVIVMVVSTDGGRVVLRLPRSGEDWDSWSSTSGGALLAAYLAGAYRDMVVPLDVTAFVEDSTAPDRSGEHTAELQPVGYIPARRRPKPAPGQTSAPDRIHPTPHQVTWYVRRLPAGHRANPEALERAAHLGMVVPPGYTFVDTYLWPRASDPRSVATALRATLAVSSLRALLRAHPVSGTESSAVENEPADSDPAALADEESDLARQTPPGDAAPMSASHGLRRHWWAFWRKSRS